MESMYRGQERFTREQLVFVVEAALAGAMDKVDGAMAQSESDRSYFESQPQAEKDGLRQFQWGAVNQVGIFIPILWAQLNGDGMGTNDFYGWPEFEALVEQYIKDKTANPGLFHPDMRPLAEKIVDENFDDYLGLGNQNHVTFSQDITGTTTLFDSEGDQVDQYTTLFHGGDDLELDSQNPWSPGIGNEYEVLLHPAYPNNENHQVPLYGIEYEDRQRFGMGPAIKAEVHSDDRAESAEFDALPWFRVASDDEIVALAGIDYGGDYAADEVAQGVSDEGVRRVLNYAAARKQMGFEVYVNEEAALNWIENERPHLLARIEAQ